MVGDVYAAPNITWSSSLPSGLSVDTGTLSPDQTFVMSNGVIAIGSAPCPESPWLCTKTEIYPSNQAFWALDANTGKVKWTIPLSNGSVIRPVAANEKLIFAAYSNPDQQETASLFKTLALDAQTGHIIWIIPRPNWNGDPLLAGNMIITPDEMNPGNWTNPDPTLTAYNSFTGALEWRIHTAPIENSVSDAAYGSGRIFAVGGQVGTYSTNMLTAYDASSGLKKWTRTLPSVGCPIYMNGVVFVTQSLDPQATPIITLNLMALNATTGQAFWNNTIGHLWDGDSWACPMVGEDHIFAFTYGGPYPALPALVAFNLSDGREVWRHTFPCEQDPLDPTMCRSVLWNHQAVGDSMVFAAAGFLYGIDADSGNVTWSYGFTADNWNPLGYVNGVLYALNTPNGFSPFLSAFAITQSTVAEMPSGGAVLILGAVLLGAQAFMALRTSDRGRRRGSLRGRRE